MLSRATCSVIACGVAGLLGGWNLAQLSGLLELPSFNAFLRLSAEDKSSLSAALLAGAFVGTLAAGPVVDSRGRRFALLLCAALFVAGAVTIAAAGKYWHLTTGRVVAGLGYSVGNIVAPAFLAEVAPPAQRGVYVNLYQTAINLGIVAAQIANAVIVNAPPPQWRSVALLPAAAALAMLVLAFFRFDHNAAASATKAEDFRIPFARMRTDPSAGKRLAVAAGLMGAQQLTAVNGVIFYAPSLVLSLGLGDAGALSAPFWAAALIGGANCVASLFAMAAVERSGRRVLLVRGGATIIASLCLIGIVRWNGGPSLAGLVGLVLFISAFQTSYGPIPFLCAAECMPTAWRGLGLTIAGLISHATSFMVVSGFLRLERAVGGGVYLAFAAVMVLITSVIATALPETKGLSLDEVDALFRSGSQLSA